MSPEFEGERARLVEADTGDKSAKQWMEEQREAGEDEGVVAVQLERSNGSTGSRGLEQS